MAASGACVSAPAADQVCVCLEGGGWRVSSSAALPRWRWRCCACAPRRPCRQLSAGHVRPHGRLARVRARACAQSSTRARAAGSRAVEPFACKCTVPLGTQVCGARMLLQKKPPSAPLNVTRWLLQCNFKKSHSKCAAAFRLQLFKGVPVQWSSRRACFQRSRRSSSLVFEQVQPRVTVLRRSAGGSTVDCIVVRGLQPPRKAAPVKKPSNDSCAGGSVISFACLHAKRGKDMFFRSPAAAPRRRT